MIGGENPTITTIFESISSTLKTQSYLNTIVNKPDTIFLNSIYDKLNSKQLREKEKQQCSKVIISIVNNLISNNKKINGGSPHGNIDDNQLAIPRENTDDDNQLAITFTIPFTDRYILPKSKRQTIIVVVFIFLLFVITDYFMQSCVIEPSNASIRNNLSSILTSGEQLQTKNQVYINKVKRDTNKDIDRINEAVIASTSMSSMIEYSRKYDLIFHKEYDKLNITKNDTIKMSIQKYYNQTLFHFNNYFPSYSWGPTIITDALKNACSNKVERHALTTTNTGHNWNFSYLFTIIGHISNQNVMKRSMDELSVTIADMNANIERMKVSLSDANAVFSGITYYYVMKKWIMFSAFIYALKVNQIFKRKKSIKHNTLAPKLTLTEEDTGVDLEQIEYKEGGKSKRKRNTKKNRKRKTKKNRKHTTKKNRKHKTKKK